MIDWVKDDGGRAEAGFRGAAGDCATRAVAIATGLNYRLVYDRINELAKLERTTRRTPTRSSAREGVHMKTMRRLMTELGWIWHPTMRLGDGTTVHVRADELPAGRLILRLSHHYSAVIDRVVRDNHDPSRDGTRCVYGYWTVQ